MEAVLAVLLLATGTDAAPACALIRPVAPDEASARRIAEAIITNIPSSAAVRKAKAAGRPYDLIIRPDPDDVGKWVAFQRPRRERVRLRPNEFVVYFAGHGLGMKIDRCDGAISEMYYQR